jgi:hypothetical protein
MSRAPRIIAVTAKAMQGEREAVALRVGAWTTTYTKPIRLHELIEAHARDRARPRFPRLPPVDPRCSADLSPRWGPGGRVGGFPDRYVPDHAAGQLRVAAAGRAAARGRSGSTGGAHAQVQSRAAFGCGRARSDVSRARERPPRPTPLGRGADLVSSDPAELNALPRELERIREELER